MMFIIFSSTFTAIYILLQMYARFMLADGLFVFANVLG